MKITQLKNITVKKSPIYYRRAYSATVNLDLMGKDVEAPLEFTIETGPLGDKKIMIDGLDLIDYPKLPLMQEVKAYIEAQDAAGILPIA
jgi:hypothetical protein